ncbi:MAG TPA: ATP-binding cassette domain-containing protein [Gemmatimonadales bacterium]|nr:ATP-binding cassette domain-containing protein [Gemmatimonadales bacterium]
MSNPVISVDGLRKAYAGGLEAVKGISFEVSAGEIFGLLGPNGAGKTTTVGVLTTTIRPTAGQVIVAGHDVVREPLEVRRATGVVFQDSVLDNDFSGLENLRLHAKLWRVPAAEARERTASLLEVMDLTARAEDSVRAYSGGMRRRLEIARALLARPRVLFLDEPTVGLDPAVRGSIWNAIRQLQDREQVTTVLTTHYLEEAEAMCDRVAIVNEGRILALDTPRALLDALGNEVLELQVDGDVRDAVTALLSLEARDPQVIGSTVTVPLHNGSQDTGAIIEAARNAGVSLAAVAVRRSTLNDVFMRLTGSRLNGNSLN